MNLSLTYFALEETTGTIIRLQIRADRLTSVS